VIESSTEQSVTVLTIDRHERRNALDLDHCRQLQQKVEQAAEKARAIVITGAGSSFCAGADLAGVYEPEFREALYGMLTAVASTKVPVIASINGPAIGAGTQLAIACDLRVAAPSARFAVPTARNGLAVDPWTVRRLSLLAGGGTARGLLVGCETYGPELAHSRGLVDRLGEHADALAWATELASLAPLSLAYSKLALEPEADQAEVEAAFEACWTSEDRVEGERARAERRPPNFSGR